MIMKIKFIKDKDGNIIDGKIVIEQHEIVIRKDIMDLATYYLCKTKFNDILELIDLAGGYCVTDSV